MQLQLLGTLRLTEVDIKMRVYRYLRGRGFQEPAGAQKRMQLKLTRWIGPDLWLILDLATFSVGPRRDGRAANEEWWLGVDVDFPFSLVELGGLPVRVDQALCNRHREIRREVQAWRDYRDLVPQFYLSGLRSLTIAGVTLDWAEADKATVHWREIFGRFPEEAIQALSAEDRGTVQQLLSLDTEPVMLH